MISYLFDVISIGDRYSRCYFELIPIFYNNMVTILAKQQVELLAFDEKLRHYADMRISLDLDDGVKVNYGKFGDLLAEVKVVHGKKADEA